MKMSAGRNKIKSGYNGGGKKMGTMVCRICRYVVLGRKNLGTMGGENSGYNEFSGINIVSPS